MLPPPKTFIEKLGHYIGYLLAILIIIAILLVLPILLNFEFGFIATSSYYICLFLFLSLINPHKKQ
jgi:hypothetical protein